MTLFSAISRKTNEHSKWQHRNFYQHTYLTLNVSPFIAFATQPKPAPDRHKMVNLTGELSKQCEEEEDIIQTVNK